MPLYHIFHEHAEFTEYFKRRLNFDKCYKVFLSLEADEWGKVKTSQCLTHSESILHCTHLDMLPSSL